MKLRALLIAAGVTAAAAAPASAAEPSSGQVTTSSPSVTWTGTIDEPFGAYHVATWFFGYMGPTCEQPHCDVFELTVGPGGESLNIKMSGDGTPDVGFEVEDPDGETDYVDFDDPEERPERERSYPAKPGEWIIRLTGAGSFDYTATASLAVPAAPSQPGGGTTTQQAPPPPPPPPPPASGEGSSAAPPASVSVRAPSKRARSARRLRRGRTLLVGVSTSAPLRDVTAVLVPARQQTRVLGKGRVASLTGTGSVRLAIGRSLKPGRYLILVGGVDEQGRRVAGRRAITVTR
ncbi:MAG TPA: hypothetical protein VHF89_18675 [Solirubrobacteraceae bacterium]|nr:hypothetical protein [Solirubrobacteraceae bacterium]